MWLYIVKEMTWIHELNGYGSTRHWHSPFPLCVLTCFAVIMSTATSYKLPLTDFIQP
jgi:hypothetical protein